LFFRFFLNIGVFETFGSMKFLSGLRNIPGARQPIKLQILLCYEIYFFDFLVLFYFFPLGLHNILSACLHKDGKMMTDSQQYR